MVDRGLAFPIERIKRTILVLRGEKVILILTSPAEALRGNHERRLRRQVRGNCGRFPGDFMFQLTPRSSPL